MNRLATMIERMQINRRQTQTFMAFLGVVIRQEAAERDTSLQVEEQRLLSALPGEANQHHLAWHLMHIATYEEGAFGPPPRQELWQRYRHGTEGTLPVPTLAQIEASLVASREYVLSLAASWADAMLDTVPTPPSEGEMTYGELLESVVWHEAHHVNQCHGNLLRQLAAGS